MDPNTSFESVTSAGPEPEVLLSGFLSILPKQEDFLDDGVSSNFIRYWVTVTETQLCYFQNEGSPEPLGNIALEDCSVEITPESQYNKKFCFELVSPTQAASYLIVAENGTQLQEFMTTIRRVMLKLRRRAKQAANKGQERRNFAAEAANGGDTGAEQTPPESKEAGTEDRLNIYRQWLQEAKNESASSPPPRDTMLQQNLLNEPQRVQRGKLAECSDNCCAIS
mmetsp:Transcript_19519/g.27389  ORF Transcript_19519/g.27389 Transcript_19519/m.27389 type:complete len:224 (-) Transcript_19519:150-821(-)|eukprot:CAMPEP_0175097670 /NCGR_PEP_ID=MMETSP0086_2-20121207/5411_1 /TAXON_ID=136419 /ORGANISM="Unknown Unknown, Strain D1" /LENGTH=223 /DNA_ID=CAMNT_0016371197 /DNA_START=54 /DNA_END=725 /DNA_ORIENTATION=-